jgi:type IV secretory pathway ATPase VirB11/archaellum biosynthesis ATPase
LTVGRRLERWFLGLTQKRTSPKDPPPLLVELFDRQPESSILHYDAYPFGYHVVKVGDSAVYGVQCLLPSARIARLRSAVAEASADLDPALVEPLTFGRLVEVLTQLAAEHLGDTGGGTNELAELAAFEAMGLSRILALAKDQNVTEFFVDSESSPVYLDHVIAGRCESTITLTERERHALETHLDTFRGYTPDYSTPSLKNDLEISGARLRISLDLEPVSVNRFALDVRRLSVSSLSIQSLIARNVISAEAAALLVAWLEAGGNITIVGETGTGKTTLLNALDEQVEPKLRRLYIEDAVETKDMLARGYHQMKVKVDPYERGGGSGRTKESEIVKALHRSPDLVVLSEIQSEEHSRAFFHALSAGARGIQTFHASSIEQALRRWVNMHGISEESLLDLGILVLMARPDRLKPDRYVQRICAIEPKEGRPDLKVLYARDRDCRLVASHDDGWPMTSVYTGNEPLETKARRALAKISSGRGD